MRVNKKMSYMLILMILLLFITIGFASLNTNLNINGISNINNPSWDIHFENIKIKAGSVTPTSAATISSTTVVTYSIRLSKPGDFYEFTVDAKNDGTIDGMISGVTSKLNGAEITILPDYLEYYVTYEDGLKILNNHLLAVGDKETYKIHIGYSQDIDASQLPDTDQALNLSLNISYVQATTSAQEVGHIKDTYTANITDINTTSNIIHIGQTIPSNITQFNTTQAVLAGIRSATNDDGIHFYLKHKVQYKVVLESYVEFEITPQMAIDFPGVTAGTYSLRSTGSTYSEQEGRYLNDSVYYESNKATILSAFGEYCGDELVSGDYRELQCTTPEIAVYIFSFGSVSAVNESWHCEADDDGSSYCKYNEWLNGQ